VRLDYVAYYNLAFIVAGVITQLISPLQPVLFPKFSTLAAQDKQQELIALYHKGCRWVAIIVFPIGFTLIFFAKEILLLWTKNPVLTENTAPILKIFAGGSICNSLMWMPYFLMLAKGNTRFTIYQNTIASIVLVPLLFWWTDRYGAFGASLVWLCVNAGYIVFSLPLFHHFFLKGELLNWIIKDTGRPFLASASLVLIVKFIQLKFMTVPINFLFFGVLMGVAGIAYLLMIPELKNIYHNFILKAKAMSLK
jgi:O-antigen/teichoic acid export membrane protein